MFKYSPKHIKFLEKNYPLLSQKELADAFNRFFGTDIPFASIRNCIRNHGIRSGRTGQFERGQEPWNKGVRGYMGANRTSFKKGSIPPKRKPLWSERISKDGYIEMKVPERDPHAGFPTRYKQKHVWIWEQTNGPVPGGSIVIFRDGNRLNCTIENLMLASRSELLSLNLHNYKEQPKELKPSVLLLAKLEAKADFRTRHRAAAVRMA